MKQVYANCDAKTEKTSIFVDSCALASCDQDSVMREALAGTQNLINDLRQRVFLNIDYQSRSQQDESENLADSFDVEYDNSYEILSSISNHGPSDLANSQNNNSRGVLQPL